MGARKDKAGKRYGMLATVSSFNKNGRLYWKCKCDCGNYTDVLSSSLDGVHTKSCGCYLHTNSKTHGLYGTRIYRIWHGMMNRCYNKKTRGYNYYGGRGVKVCEKWHAVTGFYEDMRDGYEDTFSIDRIDVNGNYCKENCRWATSEQQSYNKRNSVVVTVFGHDYKIKDLREAFGISESSYYRIISTGKTIEETLLEGKFKSRIKSTYDH